MGDENTCAKTGGNSGENSGENTGVNTCGNTRRKTAVVVTILAGAFAVMAMSNAVVPVLNLLARNLKGPASRQTREGRNDKGRRRSPAERGAQRMCP